LVEGHDINVVALVFLDDVLSVVIRVEGVHENERDVDIVGAIEVLNLSDGQIEEGHAIADFNDRLWADAAHRGTKTTVELEYGKLAQESDRLRVGKLIVVDNLVLGRRCNAIPVAKKMSD
jgi:hypothetical protein